MITATAARFPSTTNRAHADRIAAANTRRTFDGKLVGRVVETSPGRFSVLIDKNGKPFGCAPIT